MASSHGHEKRRLERGLALLSRPGFGPMLARLGVVWGAELLLSPALWAASRVASPEGRERLVAGQNRLRAYGLKWACPEFNSSS